MALRRATAGLASLIGSISRSQVKDRAVFPPLASQYQAQSTLVSLRSFLAPAAPLDDSGSSIYVAAVQTGRRSVSSASAGAALPAPAADQESLEHIRARIFGNHIGNGLRSGRKVLRQALAGKKLLEWYPSDPIKADPLMLDLKAENAKLKLDRLRRRGKAPPKKGAGKRAGKRK